MRARLARYALTLMATFPAVAVAQSASITGVATDSLRGNSLQGAFIELLPGGRQVGTDATGAFRFDSVPAGSPYRLRLMHALLDTLGIRLATPEFVVEPGATAAVNITIPQAASIVALICPPAMLERGAGALVGFVRDPDNGAVIDSVEVSLVYDESPLRQVRMPVNRTARPNATGHYAICGLPIPTTGRVQLNRNGVRSGDIAVAITEQMPLNVRSLGMRERANVATMRNEVGLLVGDGTVTGRVRTRNGMPVAEARVQVDGAAAVVLTDSAGAFTLEKVPTGTQQLTVRKLGHNLGEQAVDVVRHDTVEVAVVMEDFVPTLAPIVTVSQREKDMEDTGFALRKARGFGFYLEGDQIDRGPPTLGEALRLVPGIRVGYDASNQTGQKAMIMTSRDPRGCLRYYVDGVYWQEMGGDIEKFVRPDDLEALEMYSPATVPGEFAAASRGRCSVLVLWTRHKIRRTSK